MTGSNTGPLTNGITFSRHYGGSLVFDGQDDYIDFTAPNITNTASVEMWCKIGAGYAGKMFMGWLFYDIWCSGGRIGFNTGSGDLYGISQATVNSLGIVNAWAHYVFEFRSDVSYTNNKIYINGSLQTLSQQFGSESVSGRHFNSGNGRIGQWRGDLSSFFMPMDCAIFRVYNRALSQSEVFQNFNAHRNRYGI